MTIGILEKEHLTIILGRGDMFLFVTKFNRKKVCGNVLRPNFYCERCFPSSQNFYHAEQNSGYLFYTKKSVFFFSSNFTQISRRKLQV
jgi:hypothetical protein